MIRCIGEMVAYANITRKEVTIVNRKETTKTNASLISIGWLLVLTGGIVLIFGTGNQVGSFWALEIAGAVALLAGHFIRWD